MCPSLSNLMPFFLPPPFFLLLPLHTRCPFAPSSCLVPFFSLINTSYSSFPFLTTVSSVLFLTPGTLFSLSLSHTRYPSFPFFTPGALLSLPHSWCPSSLHHTWCPFSLLTPGALLSPSSHLLLFSFVTLDSLHNPSSHLVSFFPLFTPGALLLLCHT